MKNLLVIKEKLKNINTLLLELENEQISLIEKDIILQNIRELYVLINSMKIENNVISENEIKLNNIEKEEEIINPQQNKTEELEDKKEDKPEKIEISKNEIEEEKTIISEDKTEKPIEQIETTETTEKNSEVDDSIKKETPQQQTLFSNQQSNLKTLGETLGQNKESLNERLANNNQNDIASKISQKPISDIKAAIGIGDRFLYIRELFNGNSDMFEQTIEHLNSLNSFDTADSYIKSNFDWDNSDETVSNFINTVKRKYIKL